MVFETNNIKEIIQQIFSETKCGEVFRWGHSDLPLKVVEARLRRQKCGSATAKRIIAKARTTP